MRTILFVAVPFALAAQAPAPAAGVPVQLTVTVEPTKGNEVPRINREDVIAYQGKTRVTVSEWVALEGPSAALQLFLLIDDASSSVLGSQLGDLRQFIASQPSSTAIGLAYMRNGIADIVQQPVNDHEMAAKALRLPMGEISAGASPYLSLSDLLKKWPAAIGRREVIMISSGVDRLGGPPPQNPYLDTAMADAQRAGVIVFTIYTPPSGHAAHTFWAVYWGQNYLSELADETGGDSFMLGYQAPVTIAPYLSDITNRLSHQYRATVLMNPGRQAGFQPLRLTTEVPNAELVAAPRVYVPLGG